MHERVALCVLMLAVAACEEPPREAGPSPFGDDSATESGTTSGDDTTGLDSSISASEFTTAGPASDVDGTTMAVDPDSGSSAGSDAGSGSDSGSGSGSGSGSSGSSSSTSGFDTSNDGTLMVEVVVQSMWPAGECDDVTVTNVSDEVVVWEIELELPGTIDMAWNTTWSQMDDVGTFAGVDFNASLDPGGEAMFGFCVDY